MGMSNGILKKGRQVMSFPAARSLHFLCVNHIVARVLTKFAEKASLIDDSLVGQNNPPAARRAFKEMTDTVKRMGLTAKTSEERQLRFRRRYCGDVHVYNLARLATKNTEDCIISQNGRFASIKEHRKTRPKLATKEPPAETNNVASTQGSAEIRNVALRNTLGGRVQEPMHFESHSEMRAMKSELHSTLVSIDNTLKQIANQQVHVVSIDNTLKQIANQQVHGYRLHVANGKSMWSKDNGQQEAVHGIQKRAQLDGGIKALSVEHINDIIKEAEAETETSKEKIKATPARRSTRRSQSSDMKAPPAVAPPVVTTIGKKRDASELQNDSDSEHVSKKHNGLRCVDSEDLKPGIAELAPFSEVNLEINDTMSHESSERKQPSQVYTLDEAEEDESPERKQPAQVYILDEAEEDNEEEDDEEIQSQQSREEEEVSEEKL